MKVLMTTDDSFMIDRRILQEATSLVANGYEVTLLAGFQCKKNETYVFNGVTVKRFVYQLECPYLIKFTKFLRIRNNNKYYSVSTKLFRHFVKTFFRVNLYEKFILEKMRLEQADILHVHDFPMLESAIKFSKEKKIKLIYDAHELYYAQIQLPNKIQKKYEKMESKLIKDVDQVITVNPYIGQLMAEKYEINLPNIIYNALPTFPINKNSKLRDKFSLPKEAKIIVYQGWLSDNRGIDKIIEAAQFFDSNLYLIIIGYGDYLKVLQKLVQDYGLNNRVFFYGEVPSNDLHELTCSADLGIIPYYGVDYNNYYCSPNKLFEFTIAHIPFLANDLPFLRSIIEKYQHGEVCDLRNPKSTALLINNIFLDSERYFKLKSHAIEAAQFLNWEQEEMKLLSIYDSLN